MLSRPVLTAYCWPRQVSSHDSLYEPTTLCLMMSTRVLVASSHALNAMVMVAWRDTPSTEDVAVMV